MADKEKILVEVEQLLNNCKSLSEEINAMNEGKEFLLREYQTNKRWFREQPGRVTIEDVIKASFEFGWASKSQFDYSQNNKNNDTERQD